MVKIEVQEITEENIKFTLRHCSLAFANALRRIMIAEIPTFAIDTVYFDKNYTAMPEEMTANRLGLVPIDSTQADKYQYTSECACKEYCHQCSITIFLDVANTSHIVRNVTSKDFFVEGNGPAVGDPIYPSLITKLGTNQSIKCKCIAVKGRGKKHSKWSPVSVVAFGYDSENKHRHTKYWHEKDINEEWPAAWFSEKGEAVQSEENTYDKEPETFHFNVEAIQGCLAPVDILSRAVRILREKIQTLYNALEDE